MQAVVKGILPKDYGITLENLVSIEAVNDHAEGVHEI